MLQNLHDQNKKDTKHSSTKRHADERSQIVNVSRRTNGVLSKSLIKVRFQHVVVVSGMPFLPFLKFKNIFTSNKVTALSKSVKPGKLKKHTSLEGS